MLSKGLPPATFTTNMAVFSSGSSEPGYQNTEFEGQFIRQRNVQCAFNLICITDAVVCCTVVCEQFPVTDMLDMSHLPILADLVVCYKLDLELSINTVHYLFNFAGHPLSCFIPIPTLTRTEAKFVSHVSTLTRDIDRAILSVCPCVCLSIRPSVRFWYSVDTP